ncbi:MAG: DUF960 domain-containing protein [Fusobacterium mortiferum]|nr:DUF960 domain-containing protein [Fusobacterium mortiferum]
MRTIFMTPLIRHDLDVRALLMVVSALRLKEEKEETQGLDPFQIFEFKDKKMINRQEEPQDKREFDLSYEVKECKVWAVLGLDETFGEYWTIMFPSEY